MGTFASAEDARAADPSSALLSRDRYTRHGRQRTPPRRHARRMSQTSSRRALAVALFALIALAAIAECVDAHKTHHKHKHYYKPKLHYKGHVKVHTKKSKPHPKHYKGPTPPISKKHKKYGKKKKLYKKKKAIYACHSTNSDPC